MIRLAWKPFTRFGFILFLIFFGCSPKQPSVEELVLQADELLKVGQIESAILILERGLEQDPNRVDLLEPLAFAYAAEGDSMLSAMTFMRIAELVRDQPEYLLYAAQSLIEAGDTRGAVAPYKKYLKVRPQDRPVWVTLAELEKDNGRISEALEAFLAAEQVESRASQQISIADLYLQSQNLAQAQAWYARALEGDSDFRDESLLGLLETAIRSKRFSEAQDLLVQLDAEFPGVVDRSELSEIRNQLAEWQRRREAAMQALADLKERESQLESLAQEPVEEVQASGEPDTVAPVVAAEVVDEEPLALFDEPAQMQKVPTAIAKPADPVAEDHVSLARAAEKKGELGQSIRHYKQALVENDNQPWIWAELSEAYLTDGQDRWAQATAKEAIRREPDNASYALLFLRAAQKTMDIDRLVREMENTYRKFPNNPEVILVLGRVFADQGNSRNARILYQRFLEVAPEDHPERESVENELSFLGG